MKKMKRIKTVSVLCFLILLSGCSADGSADEKNTLDETEIRVGVAEDSIESAEESVEDMEENTDETDSEPVRPEKEEVMEEENLTEDEFYSKYGTQVIAYNSFDADAFIDLLEDMKASVNDEDLQNDLQKVIDETRLAADTHEVEHAVNIYRLLHDMDYYLLRYGPDKFVSAFSGESGQQRLDKLINFFQLFRR